jgi:hypothetical protein
MKRETEPIILDKELRQRLLDNPDQAYALYKAVQSEELDIQGTPVGLDIIFAAGIMEGGDPFGDQS